MIRRFVRSGIMVFLATTLLMLLTGCTNDNKVFDGKIDGYNILVKEIENVMNSLSLPSIDHPILEQLKAADPEKRSEIAMYLADDMAVATTFGFVTDEILAISGEAVKAYPHPLLLNNYATMLFGTGDNEAALFFYVQALNQEPDNPILLTNIANLYLEQENFEAAKDYATMALQTMNDYGPAYQVLTTIHLHDGNSELAAETMVKSAKHAFNDISIHHFDSFLSAIDGLDPSVDEYPLHEEHIAELYEIARTNVDTKDVNTNVDTPAAQITIQPFPMVGSAEQLMYMREYLDGEHTKLNGMFIQAIEQSIDIGQAFTDYMQLEAPSDEHIPVLKNLRQYYAYRVLESYYNFKLKQLLHHFVRTNSEYNDRANEQIKILNQNHWPKDEKLKQSIQESAKKLLAETLSGGQPDQSESTALIIEQAQGEVDWQLGKLEIQKQYANQIIQDAQRVYNESKQLIEEFWLKSGGLLKYIVTEEVFDYVNIRREQLIYTNLTVTLQILSDHAGSLSGQQFLYGHAKRHLDLWKGVQEGPAEPIAEEINAEDLTPKIEREALATYPEAYDTGDIIIGPNMFGHSVTLTYNGDYFDLSYDTLFFGGKGIQWSPYTPNQYRTYTLNDVRMEGNTNWFKKADVVQRAFNNAGKIGETVGKIGRIGIGFTNHTRTGTYTTKTWDGAIIDYGSLHIREQGGSIGDFGKINKVEVIRSQMTGVAEKKTSTIYSFKFVGHGS